MLLATGATKLNNGQTPICVRLIDIFLFHFSAFGLFF